MARDVTFLVHFSVYPCSCTVELALQHLSDHFSPWRMQWGIVGVCLSAWHALDQPKALHVFSELTTGAAFFFFVFSVFSDFSGFSRVSAFSAAGVVATSAASAPAAGAALAAWRKDMLSSDFFRRNFGAQNEPPEQWPLWPPLPRIQLLAGPYSASHLSSQVLIKIFEGHKQNKTNKTQNFFHLLSSFKLYNFIM